MRKSTEVRQDGLLYIDRDEAVRKHLKALREMVRPGNVRGAASQPAPQPRSSAKASGSK